MTKGIVKITNILLQCVHVACCLLHCVCCSELYYL